MPRGRRGKNITQSTLIANATVFGGKVNMLSATGAVSGVLGSLMGVSGQLL